MNNQSENKGSLLLFWLKELNLNQAELTERVGLSDSELTMIRNGQHLNILTVNKISLAIYDRIKEELHLCTELTNVVRHYLVLAISMFALEHDLSILDACRYLREYKGIDFVIDNFEVEHLLSLKDCVDDMVSICKCNGGTIG